MNAAERTANPALAPARVPAFRPGAWGDVRGAVLSGLLSLVTTISYSTVAGGALASLGENVVGAMVLSGLIAASLGALVASALGSVPTQIFSPRASVAVVIAAAAGALGAGHGVPAAQVLGGLVACLLLAAILQLVFAALRLGDLVRLIPSSVISGLVIALAIKLAWSQLPALEAADPAHPWAPLAAALVTLGAFAALRWRLGSGIAQLGGLAAGLVCAALIASVAPQALPRLPSVAADSAPLLPLWRLADFFGPELPWHRLPELAVFAFVIALVNSVETLTSALQLEDMGTRRFDANRALMAGACGSLVSLCAGGLPLAGGTSTSSVHVRAGGRSRASALASALLVGLGTLALGPQIGAVPLAVVAALLLCVAGEIALAPLREIASHWNSSGVGPRAELGVVVLVVTLLLSTDILTGLGAGIVASSVLAFSQMRSGLVGRLYNAVDAMRPTPLRGVIVDTFEQGIPVIELRQPLFFATAEAAVLTITRVCGVATFSVLDLSHSPGMDATAAKALARCATALNREGRHLLLIGGDRVVEFESQLKPCQVFAHLGDAFDYCIQMRMTRRHA